MSLLLLSVFLFHILCMRFILCDSDNRENIRISISMTTIPPRMSTIHHTITSWLQQTLKPRVINIIVPRKYTRFHDHFERIRTEVWHSLINDNLNPNNDRYSKIKLSIQSPQDLLKYYINKTHPIELSQEIIKIHEIEYDYGPVCKYMGRAVYDKDDDYWIIGDDDVYYSSNIIERYFDAGLDLHKDNYRLIYTHFAPTKRLSYTINIPVIDEVVGVDDTVSSIRNGVYEEKHLISHLQGVDTVLFPIRILQHQEEHSGPLSYFMKEFLIKYFHTVCPLSFYQDDYIISYLVHLADLDVHSAWDSHIQVVNHIDHVSKSNNQMHMNTKEVVERERSTVDCIVAYAHRVNDMLMLCANDAVLCNKLKKKLFIYENKNSREKLIRKESISVTSDVEY